MVVHAQILLNQYKNFPVRAIKESAFAAGLKSQMELRRHAKLYMRPPKQAKAGKSRSNSNPMRDRASVRAAPMTATATNMVRAIWQSYFPSDAAAEGGSLFSNVTESAPPCHVPRVSRGKTSNPVIS